MLLLHGFGVGAFIYEVNLRALAAQGFRAYAVDLLGQGESWPRLDALEEEIADLQFSCDTWIDQIQFMGQQLALGPVILAGNSLGGFLGVHLAAIRPDLVSSLVLMNATPFWSFQPHPDRSVVRAAAPLFPPY